MRGGQIGEHAVPLAGQPQPDHPVVDVVPHSLQQAERGRPVDELAERRVPHQQVLRRLPDGRLLWTGMTTDGEQQLALRVRETALLGGAAAPLVEAAQSDAEGEQPLVVRSPPSPCRWAR